jgi:hypothetical protein
MYRIELAMPLFLGFFHVKSFQNENCWGNRQQFSFSFPVFPGGDKDQEIPSNFMQDIAQGGLHPGEKHIPPSRILPGFPEIPVPQLQYRI